MGEGCQEEFELEEVLGQSGVLQIRVLGCLGFLGVSDVAMESLRPSTM